MDQLVQADLHVGGNRIDLFEARLLNFFEEWLKRLLDQGLLYDIATRQPIVNARFRTGGRWNHIEEECRLPNGEGTVHGRLNNKQPPVENVSEAIPDRRRIHVETRGLCPRNTGGNATCSAVPASRMIVSNIAFHGYWLRPHGG